MFMTMAALPAKKICLLEQQPPIIATASIAGQQTAMILTCLNGGKIPFYQCYLIRAAVSTADQQPPIAMIASIFAH